MPFDKHIIGQVPAVIRAVFNVSKLEKERGAPGPRAICYPVPSPLDIAGASGRGGSWCQVRWPRVQFSRPTSSSPGGDQSWGRDTGESPSHRHGAGCWKARFFYFITGMWQEHDSLMSFKYAPLISCSEPSQDGFFILANRERWYSRQVHSPVVPLTLDTCWAFWDS